MKSRKAGKHIQELCSDKEINTGYINQEWQGHGYAGRYTWTDLNGDGIDDVTAADDVTLFLTTGGVELINPDNSIYNRTKPKSVCTTPNGVDTASLQALLHGFQMRGGNVMICPLCAMSRDITEPTTGDMGNGGSIHNLFLNADKVITF